jgi:ferrochelatase
MRNKTKIVLLQLGSPKSPSISDVRSFLREFLSDPRVVDLPGILWKSILYLFILPFRPAKSARLYSRIWNGSSFPLVDNSKKFSSALARKIPSHFEVTDAYIVSSAHPTVTEVWDSWESEALETRASRCLIVPMFPQYSESTTASGMDRWFHELKGRVQIPSFEILTHFHNSKAFIDSSVKIITEELTKKNVDAFVISFHGIPKRRVTLKKDAYYRHCFETYILIKRFLPKELQDKMHLTFQSRFGSEEWLTPYTENYVGDLIKNGQKKIAIYCPSFVADCLETIDEINHELREFVRERGGELYYIPCLNDRADWVESFSHFVTDPHNDNNKYFLTENEKKLMETPKMSQTPLTTPQKKILKTVFLTLFLDLVGFSILFPLFPALAKHYLETDSQNFILQGIFKIISLIAPVSIGEGLSTQSLVLFGGLLGAFYSLLQFIASPFWGMLSDRVGRRPVLLISTLGMFLSYVLWFFSGSFTLLVLARLVGGLMGGNISTATAVVADVTDESNRSKGMAFVGIAFALGFIIGPALGGIFSHIDLTVSYPALAAYGVNPFSMAAVIAGTLSFINFFMIARSFPETLPPEKRGKGEVERTANVFKLFKPLPYPAVNRVNFANFLFIAAFSGMEFTLTFLAFERFAFSSMDNAKMFIFVGFVLVLVQGGYVRRRAHQVGEKKLALIGLIILIPGLILIGQSMAVWWLFGSLVFLATGSGMVVPCLTTMASLFSPATEQGRCLGHFRSLGALARTFGPLAASLCYWRFGATMSYTIGAFSLIIPVWLVSTLPQVEKKVSA